MNLEVGKRYVVTKGSDDGTFIFKDHIRLEDSGDIVCIEQCGWINAVDVPEATRGMEVEIDQAWIERRRQKLLAELESL